MSSGGSSGGVKIAPPGPVEILLENSILDALNLFGKDPNAMIPSAAMIASFVNYATKLIEAEKLYRELPKEFDETLTPIVKEYKGKLEGIANELGLNFEDLKETVDVLKGQFGENLDEFKKNFEEYREAETMSKHLRSLAKKPKVMPKYIRLIYRGYRGLLGYR